METSYNGPRLLTWQELQTAQRTDGPVVIRSSMLVCDEQHVNLLVGLRDRGLEKVDMRKHLGDQQAVVLEVESMGQRLT